jgi:hypothetical protein
VNKDGYRKMGHKRNEIREELNIFDLNDKVIDYRKRWTRHISPRIPKQFPHYELIG